MDAKSEEKRLSDQNYQNIARKQRILEEEEVANNKQLDRNLSVLKSQNAPKRQRKISTMSKRKRKPASIVEKHANFRQIPSNLGKHFPADHVIMSMKPDGLCGVSCESTHIFCTTGAWAGSEEEDKQTYGIELGILQKLNWISLWATGRHQWQNGQIHRSSGVPRLSPDSSGRLSLDWFRGNPCNV